MPTTNDRAEVYRMLREIHRIEHRGVVLARAITQRMRLEATDAFAQGRLPRVMKYESQLLDTLKRVMEVLAMLGYRRSLLQASIIPSKTIAAGFLEDMLESLERLLKDHYTGLAVNPLGSHAVAQAVMVVTDTVRSTQEELRQSINELIVNGATVKEGTAKLREDFDRLGLTAKNSFKLEAIYRTQSQIAYNGARWKGYQDPEVQEILWGYKYITVGDDRVRPEHEALDGVTLPKDHAFWLTWWPPNGYNCRCSVVPVFEPRTIVLPRKLADGRVPQQDPNFNYNPGIL